jgi:hypothetical protein
MPSIIDSENLPIDDLPTIWSPVQWELSDAERITELENQATASLLWSACAPEAILRLLLGETEIERAFNAPTGYDPEAQGEWNEDMITFQFKRPARLNVLRREGDHLYLEYDFGDLGLWALDIAPEGMSLQKL